MKKSKNYHPWNIDIASFPEGGSLKEQILFLLNFPILAPSGHNSQPWSFSVEGNMASIHVNEERALSYSDTKRRQLLIAMGCALENLLVAADYYGFDSDVRYFPNASDHNVVVSVVLRRARPTQGDLKHLIFSIPERRTNRGKYEDRLPPEDFLKGIEKLSSASLGVALIGDKNRKDKIAEIVSSAQVEVMEDILFREELSHYIKSNFTKSKTGMPGFALGVPAPISLIASRLIKKVNLSEKTRKQDEEVLKKFTPVFVVISAADDKMGHIQSGRLFEKIWLMAERRGMSMSPLAAAVQANNHAKTLQEMLGIKHRPLIFSRLGYAEKKPHHSPRFNLEEVLNIGNE